MARATAVLFFLGALLLCKAHEGVGFSLPGPGCEPSDISVQVKNQTTYYHGVLGSTVTFQTKCACPMTGVRVTCDGIERSTEAWDTSLVEVSKDGKTCILQQPLVNFRVISGGAECGWKH
ncbi:hypothetical protein QOZ80_9AG0683010 [Eleusine coracana subsp. coracana]|nr:hypothetical protein QOZ80_9AG0683010 [Eleusine coracana subsp. coracana]